MAAIQNFVSRRLYYGLLLRVEIVPSDRKIFDHNITKVHQVIQAFLKRVVNRSAFCREAFSEHIL